MIYFYFRLLFQQNYLPICEVNWRHHKIDMLPSTVSEKTLSKHILLISAND